MLPYPGEEYFVIYADNYQGKVSVKRVREVLLALPLLSGLLKARLKRHASIPMVMGSLEPPD